MSQSSDILDTYADWKDWSAESFARYSRTNARYWRWHLQRAHPAPLRSVLELGFGNGQFLGYLRDHGVQAVGVELQPLLCERAREAGFAAYTDVDAVPVQERFDLVAAFDVIEHIEPAALPALLRQIKGRLAPGGVVLLRFPNGQSPFGREYQYGDWTHVSVLGADKLAHVARLCGLRVVRWGEWPWWRESFNPVRLLRGVVQALLGGAIAFGFRIDSRNLSKNMVVVLAAAPAATAAPA